MGHGFIVGLTPLPGELSARLSNWRAISGDLPDGQPIDISKEVKSDRFMVSSTGWLAAEMWRNPRA